MNDVTREGKHYHGSGSKVGKLYGRGLIKQVRAGTECAIAEEQCGFRQGAGCMYLVFAVRQVCEKLKAVRSC